MTKESETLGYVRVSYIAMADSLSDQGCSSVLEDPRAIFYYNFICSVFPKACYYLSEGYFGSSEIYVIGCPGYTLGQINIDLLWK